jgi:ABC-2 type transport system ATP-binding protein
MPAASRRVLRRVGSLVEGPAFHPYLSGRANLARLDAADRYSDPRTSRMRIDSALDRVGLLAAANKRYRAYSLGMRQRLAIANSLLMPRDLLVLDEPTNGLDPQGTREVRHLIGELARDGATVLVSSHLLAEVEQICSHVGVMYEGRLVAQAPVTELRAGTAQIVRVDTDRTEDAARVLNELGLSEIATSAGYVTATLGEVAVEKIVPNLVNACVPVLGFAVQRPSLEDVFVSLTGEGFDVSG